jgi:hypothetical protein
LYLREFSIETTMEREKNRRRPSSKPARGVGQGERGGWRRAGTRALEEDVEVLAARDTLGD